MDKVVGQRLLAAAEMIEQHVDAKLEPLDKMDEDDFEALGRKRMMNMKKAEQQKKEWMQNGHGRYEEIADESEFFSVCKKSQHVVCHFYRDSTFYCKVVDKHLSLLATKHIEARFVRINAEHCQFLVERLRIKVMPTICLAKDGKTVDYVVGLSDLGGKEDFSTEMLEWRIAQAKVIDYSGDLQIPPLRGSSKKSVSRLPKKTIRGGESDDSDDD